VGKHKNIVVVGWDFGHSGGYEAMGNGTILNQQIYIELNK
jgi:hypothetical protein